VADVTNEDVPESEGSGLSRGVGSIGSWLALGAGLIAALLLLAVDIFPIVTNDSLAYIEHSNALGEFGFVQLGYRQVGYPFFLAFVDFFSSAARLEPLIITAVLQRLILLGALAFSVWLWGWRSLPLVAFVITPTLIVYTNFMLTEGIGVGLSLWYAALVAWALRLGVEARNGDQSDQRQSRMLILAASAAVLVYLALVTIRFQYILMIFGVLAVLFVMYRAHEPLRRIAGIMLLVLLVIGSGFLALLSRETHDEYGVWVPSARSERVQYWATWQVTFRLAPENTSNPELEDLYANGNPNPLIGELDKRPLAEQRVAYSNAMDRLITQSGSTWTAERFRAFLGVLRGGRIDDIRSAVTKGSRTQYETVQALIYSNGYARRKGVEMFLDQFNGGRRIEPILISPIAPVRGAPYFRTLLPWMILAAIVVLAGGLALGRTRVLAIVGSLTLLVTASVFGFFLMDNVRFIIVQLLFVLAAATGVADEGWRHLRVRGNR
jgi:hypothetical protein